MAWGYYDATAKPVLRIQSGDTVEVQTLITNSPTGLERAFVPPDQIEQSLKDIFKEVTDKGPGGHILTGPIYIEVAEGGTRSKFGSNRIQPRSSPMPYTAFSPRGRLPSQDFPRQKIKIIQLDQRADGRQNSPMESRSR